LEKRNNFVALLCKFSDAWEFLSSLLLALSFFDFGFFAGGNNELYRQICDQREFLGIYEFTNLRMSNLGYEFTTQNSVDNDEFPAATFDQWHDRTCLWQRKGR